MVRIVWLNLRNIRLIARLDIKAPNLVKGIQFEGLRKLGDPQAYALNYYNEGIDEIYYLDIVASLYERNSLTDIIKEATRDVFVPVTVGGGLRSCEDVINVLRAGADKVSINTAAIKNPTVITDVARRFGSQCMVLSIEAKKKMNRWEAYYDNGREPSGLDVVEWAMKGESLGAGEIILTSIDQEGTVNGFDNELVHAVTSNVDIPVVASGGMGKLSHLESVVKKGNADAIAMAHVLHYGKLKIKDIRQFCKSNGVPVRRLYEI